MIARSLRMNDSSKSNVTRLVNYLTDSQGHEQRVADVRITNCISEDPQWAALEMTAVQRGNTRAQGDKTYHLMLSFHEKPSLEVIHAIEDAVCARLGFEGHQRMSVLHDDTDNLHLHVCINKIHPEHLTMHTPYYDHKTLAKTCEQLEQHYSLVPDNHIPKAEAVETAAKSMECAGDLESLIGWIQRTCAEDMKQTGSWQELHGILDAHGLTIKERGNGLVFVSGGLHVKASSVDRSFSKKRLMERFGPFEAAQASQKQSRPESSAGYRKKPMQHGSFDASALWKHFLDWREEEDRRRDAVLKAARGERDRELTAATRMADARTLVIRNMVEGAIMKRVLHSINRARLQRKKEEIKAKYRTDLARAQNKGRPTWRSWLHDEAMSGNTEALAAMRARDERQQRSGTSSTDAAVKITRKGTVIQADGSRDSGLPQSIPKQPFVPHHQKNQNPPEHRTHRGR